MVGTVERSSEKKPERRKDGHRDERIHAESIPTVIREISPDDHERGMRDIYDIEHPERDGHADCHRSVETAQENAGNDGVDEQVPAEIHQWAAFRSIGAGIPTPFAVSWGGRGRGI